MKVYRYLSQKELDLILANNISSIGHEYSQNEKYRRVNNHRYKTGVKYLHFFKHKKDCEKAEFLSDHKDVEFYIAEFNIPITTLIRHIGYGTYNRWRYSDELENIIEFAIPTSKFKSKYMLSYALDEIHHRSIKESKSLNEMLKRCIFKKSTFPGLQEEYKEEKQLANEERTLGY